VANALLDGLHFHFPLRDEKLAFEEGVLFEFAALGDLSGQPDPKHRTLVRTRRLACSVEGAS
jgi:hypothetical protein